MIDSEKLPPIHPGEILNEEFLMPLGMSHHQLAKAIGADAQLVRAIVCGKQPITAETALLLSRYFGTSAELWTGMQVQYDLDLAEDRMDARLDAVKPHPTNGITSDTELPPPGECKCGCGGELNPGSVFSQGHDQKALHKVIKSQYGSVLEFLEHHGYVSNDDDAARRYVREG